MTPKKTRDNVRNRRGYTRQVCVGNSTSRTLPIATPSAIVLSSSCPSPSARTSCSAVPSTACARFISCFSLGIDTYRGAVRLTPKIGAELPDEMTRSVASCKGTQIQTICKGHGDQLRKAKLASKAVCRSGAWRTCLTRVSNWGRLRVPESAAKHSSMLRDASKHEPAPRMSSENQPRRRSALISVNSSSPVGERADAK